MSSRNDVFVDPDASNNTHSIALRMVGCNRRVLELGASTGYMTRALAIQNNRVTAIENDADAAVHLKDAAEEVVIGDLNSRETLSTIAGPFDVVLAGDVLQHLLDPDGVLLQITELLAPGGRVVISLPNVAHADVRIALLQGTFDYSSLGLLEKTHIRFFTRKTIQEMTRRAGLVITDLQRVRVPAFETELKIDRRSVPTAVLDEIHKDPEAETYHFVFTAVRDDGSDELTRLAEKHLALQHQHDSLVIAHGLTKMKVRNLKARAARLDAELATVRGQLRSLRASRVVRYSARLRRLVGKTRGAAR